MSWELLKVSFLKRQGRNMFFRHFSENCSCVNTQEPHSQNLCIAAASRSILPPSPNILQQLRQLQHTHKLYSSSFLWCIFRILYDNPKKELLCSLWVFVVHHPSDLLPYSRQLGMSFNPFSRKLREYNPSRRPLP